MLIGKSYTCYSKTDRDPISILLECKNRPDTLLFESGAIALLSQWETESIKKNYSKVLDAYGCLGVLKINIDEDEIVHFLILVTGCTSVGKILESEIFRLTATHFVPLQENQDEEGTGEMRKLLNSGTFYFSVSQGKQLPLDLSLSAQRQYDGHKPDNRFMWNRSLHIHLQRFGINCSEWLLSTTCGSVEIRTVYAGAKQARACLISRLSCERAGTRFYVRGTNDEGHVANFVETEQLIVLDDMITSFVQTRGSVPVFWEQPGLQVGSHKVKLSRAFEASSPAFDRHFTALKGVYGDILIVNLLGSKEGENTLSRVFQDQLKDSIYGHDTPMICFDYHRHGGRSEKLKQFSDKARPSLNKHGFFFSRTGKLEKRQKGVTRSNCLDCIDRTNCIQTFLALEMLSGQLECLGLSGKASLASRFQEAYKAMWTQNGDHISRMYVGTGALDGKAKVASKLRDGARSVKRTIRSNFLDGSKQEAIDLLLLGNTFVGELGERARALLYSSFLHSSHKILRELCDRHLEYTTWSNIRVCVGTWNVNGGRHFRSLAHKHQTMHDWLLDFHTSLPESGYSEVDNVDFKRPTDIFAIGFEELVDLNASNMVSTSSTQRKEWGEELRRVISRDFPYVLITCEQLVGVCLFVFVRPHLVPYIQDVAVSAVKTGLGGSAGNKGGVAIRMLLNATSLCFICSHLAAGQSGVQDRNNDYLDIASRIAFPMGRSIRSHDYVFWCGDFNYRIDMAMEEVKSLIKQQNWEELGVQDQLNKQIQGHKVFRGFIEGKLSFPPTYKYDLFSDDYDTSEKMRIPAWTDRVLWRRRKPRYKSADHVRKHVIKKETGTRTEDLLIGEVEQRDEEELDEDEDDEEEEDVTHENTGDKEKSSSDTSNIHFLPGKVLYYGRAELKTSDHRPVVGLLEIEIQEVDWARQRAVHEDVMKSMGPADPSIVVTSDPGGEEDDGIDVGDVLEAMESCGDAVLVRAVDDEIIVTFDDGRSALKALEFDGTKISGKTAHIRLKCDSLLSSTDLTVETLISNTSVNLGSESYSVLTPVRSRALSDLLSSSSDKHSTLPVLEPIRIQTLDGEDDSGESGAEDDADYDSDDSDDSQPEADRGTTVKPAPQASKPKPPRPVQPKRAPPPRPAALPTREVSRKEEILVCAIPEDDEASKEAIGSFDPLAQKKPEGAKPTRPPPPKRPERPAPPKIQPSKPPVASQPSEQEATVSEPTTSVPSAVKPTTKSELGHAPKGRGKTKGSYGRTQIGMPFNVQHLGHVSADNIEALLEAAKDDPKLLPSFLAGDTEGSKDDEAENKPSKPPPETRSDAPATIENERPAARPRSKPQPAPRPTPAPRPRSWAQSQPELRTKADIDIAHARPAVKPKPSFKSKSAVSTGNLNIQEESAENRVTSVVVKRPSQQEIRPLSNLNQDTSQDEPERAPVAPARRRNKPPPTRPRSLISESKSEENTELDQRTASAGEIKKITTGESGGGNFTQPPKPGPPPIPKRVDLE